MAPFSVFAPWILLAAGTGPGAPPGGPDDATAGVGNALPADIADIKPPVVYGLDPDWVRYGLFALAVTVLIAAAVFAWRLWRKRRKGYGEVSAPRLSAEELARLHLANLAAEMTPGKAFYFRLSAILREYLMGRYGIGAVEMTTEELLPYLGRIDLPEALRIRLRRLLVHADGVKFAAAPAEASRCREDLAFSQEFIDGTTPKMDASNEAALPSRQAHGRARR